MSPEISTIDPEVEPEFVGSHSALAHERCQDFSFGDPNDPLESEQCENDATHTVVMFSSGRLHEVGMCDECGAPEDLESGLREWTEEVMD